MGDRDKSLPVELKRKSGGHFVQTDRAAHEKWAKLTIKSPTSSVILHWLAAHVGQQNAVVVSQAYLAKVLQVSERSVIRAVQILKEGNWVQVVRLGAGKEYAYVLNDRVVWTEKRDNLRYSSFSAEVIADYDQQDPETLEGPELTRIPRLFSDETQLPSGEGLPPESQPFLSGMEPDLPSTPMDET